MKSIEPLTILERMDMVKYKVGDTVWVALPVGKQLGWRAAWNPEMLYALGKTFEVVSVNDRDGYALNTKGKSDMSQDFWFPDGALRTGLDLRVGDVVYVALDPIGWFGWTAGLKECVGKGATVAAVYDGFVKLDNGFEFPTYALSLITRGGNVDKEITAKNIPEPKKAKRVRVGPGPWDQAPCTHLRWHLMGFFREKLAFKKSKTMVKAPLPGGKWVEVEAEVASVEVVCTKCNKTMTLNAK
jgi:hypothetical protein